MGNYLTYDPDSDENDLRRFISDQSLTNIVLDIGVDADRTVEVNKAIDDAESFVDSYLGRRYTVPIAATVPPVVENATGVLTVEGLYLRGNGVPAKLSERADGIRAWLVDISKGTAALPDQSPVPTEATSSGVVTIEAEDRELTREDLGFW